MAIETRILTLESYLLAARLTVVVSQAFTRNQAATHLEETLVAELMMTPGLDATMIGPLENVQLDDTDFLCLSSFRYTFAFVSWHETSEVQHHWRRMGLNARIRRIDRSDAGGDASPQESGGVSAQSVIHFQLTPDSQIPQLLAEMQRILRDRNVKTVGISLGGLSEKNASFKETASSDGSAKVSQPPALTEKRPEQQPADRYRVKDSERTDTGSQDGLSQEDEQWQHLDRLVDDFDALDL